MPLFDAKPQYYVQLCRRMSGVLTIVKTVRLKGDSQKVSYKNEMFIINSNFPSYKRKSKVYYQVDLAVGQITATKPIPELPKQLADLTFRQETARQLMSTMETIKMNGMMIMIAILAAGLGLAAGFIIGQNVVI